MSITILGIITIIALLLGMSSYIIKRLSNNSIFYYALFTPSIFTLYEWINKIQANTQISQIPIQF
jgi:hypothetical protein